MICSEKFHILEIRDLSVSFRQYDKGTRQVDLPVISRLNVAVHEGEIVAVVGSSGSGKSLLAHAVMGLLPSNARCGGDIYFLQEPLTPKRLAHIRGKEIALVPQSVMYTIAAFLGSRNRTLPYLCSVRVTDSDHETDLPVSLLPCLPGALFPGCAVLLRPHSSDTMRYRNLNLLSIGYALKPRLRPRLTQGRSALPWKPWIFGLEDSHLHLATHSGILSS